jgi:hypothetical protein
VAALDFVDLAESGANVIRFARGNSIISPAAFGVNGTPRR